MDVLQSDELAPDKTFETGSPAVSESHRESQNLLQPVMERLQHGERGALRELFELTAPTLFSMTRQVLHNSAGADEVITDVYIQVSRTAAQYDPSRSSVITWLLLICRARVIQQYRTNQSASIRGPSTNHAIADRLFNGDSGADGTAAATEDFNAANIDKASSPTSPRDLLNMAFFRGLGRHEIAAETALALGTVKAHLRLALSALRVEMQEKHPRDVNRTLRR